LVDLEIDASFLSLFF